MSAVPPRPQQARATAQPLHQSSADEAPAREGPAREEPVRRFERARQIRFSDCDPAGIVFYPQYFVMLNGLVEDWIDAIGVGYRHLIADRRVGLPTVRLEVDFTAISRMGDAVVLALAAEHIGRRSLQLDLRCEGAAGDLRLRVRQVLVTTSLETHRSIDVPADLRAAIASYRNRSV